MKTIGLTGGIATGKSTVAEMLREQYNVALIDADQVAREIVEPGTPALRDICETFGDEVLLPTGSLNRKALGQIVMADPQKRRALEQITHPRIGETIQRWLMAQAANATPLAVVEAALMVESGSYRLYDVLVVVSCTRQTQMTRLREREGFDTDVAQCWLDAQLPLAEKEAVADHIVRNDGDLAELTKAVEALWLPLNAEPTAQPAD